MSRRARSKSVDRVSKNTPLSSPDSDTSRRSTRSVSSNKNNTRKQSTRSVDVKKVVKKTVTTTKSVVTRKKKVVTRKKSEKVVVTKERLRPRKGMKFIWRTNVEDFDGFEDLDDAYEEEDGRKKRRKRIKGEYVERKSPRKGYSIEDFEDIYEDESAVQKEHMEELDKIPKNKKQLKALHDKVEDRLKFYRDKFFSEQKELAQRVSHVPKNAIPINADVRTFDFKKLQDAQKKLGGRLFDVIMIDPPWQLSTSTPSRGVAIAYESLSDDMIEKIPIPKLQDNGFIFLWTINAKYSLAIKLLEKWGYSFVDEVTWIKKTINGKIAKGHGFYLQHAKESCLVGVKGKLNSTFKRGIGSDIIFSQRRGQSQKPEEIYTLIEELAPNGFYLEVFGRRNNLRDRWVTIGNEL